MSNGKVLKTGYTPGGGNFVNIDYGNGTIGTYRHLTEILVKETEIVEKGMVVAIAGNTGKQKVKNAKTGEFEYRPYAPHLHYELSVNGKKRDPGSYDWDRHEDPNRQRSTLEEYLRSPKIGD